MRRCALLLMTGCFTAYSKLPNDRPDPKVRKIEEATILDMKVHLHKQPGLCPGKEGKMYVSANVQWPGAKPVARTLGADTDSLHPESFEIKGKLVKGDKNAHLFPDKNVLASVEKGFDAHVVFKPNPKFAFDVNWAPEYSCYFGWFVDGAVGDNGGYGESGGGGDVGQSGGNGAPGQRGGRGRDGGRIRAFVTIVQTKYYPRLIAVIANDNFFLAPADRAIEFGAAGGQGGTGGQGGSGGDGGDQPIEGREVTEDGTKVTKNFATGSPGNGGNAANGGGGGSGGNGGSIEVIFDSRFPELQRLIKTDVRGGAGGYGGAAGNPGNGGGSSADVNPANGNPGAGGNGGEDGNPGREGRASVRGGSVGSMFELPGIAIAGNPAPSQAPPPGPAPIKKRRHR